MTMDLFGLVVHKLAAGFAQVREVSVGYDVCDVFCFCHLHLYLQISRCPPSIENGRFPLCQMISQSPFPRDKGFFDYLRLGD